jgi:hypothetical protein
MPIRRALHLSGLEPLVIDSDALFVNVGERTNVTGSAQFKKLIKEDRYDEAVEVARQQVANGAQILDVNMDEGLLDAESGDGPLSQPDRLGAGHQHALPVMVDSSKWEIVIEAGLKRLQGKGVVNSISAQGRRGTHPRTGTQDPAVRCGQRSSWPSTSRARPTASSGASWRSAKRSYRLLTEKIGFPPRRHHLRSQHFRGRHRHRRAQRLRGELHRSHANCIRRYPHSHDLGRRVQRVFLVPGQQHGARGHPFGVSVPRHQGRHDHGHRQRRPLADL